MNHRGSKFPKRSIEAMIAMGCNVGTRTVIIMMDLYKMMVTIVIGNRKLFYVGLNWRGNAYEGRVNRTQACTCKITSII